MHSKKEKIRTYCQKPPERVRGRLSVSFRRKPASRFFNRFRTAAPAPEHDPGFAGVKVFGEYCKSLFLPGKTLLSVLQNESGFVLSVGLMLLAVLTLLGITGVMISTTDLKISNKYRGSGQAFYSAEAGIQEARARLRGEASAALYAGDPAANPDPTWLAYIVTSSSWQTSQDKDFISAYKNYFPTTSSHTSTSVAANSLQSNLAYWVKIKHKREYDAEQKGHTPSSTHYYDGDGSTATHTSAAPGNIIYYGYGNPALPTKAVPFTKSGATGYQPIEIIKSYGSVGGSSSVVEVEIAWDPGPPIKSSVYGRGNITINGSSGFISGNDNCGQADPKSPVYTLLPATTTGSPTYAGNPPYPVSGTEEIDIAALVNELKKGATVVTTDQNGTNFGGSGNFVTVYSNTSDPYNVQGLKIQNGTGYGLLLVEGDLTLGAGVNWDGIILVTGTLTLNGGGGGINIRGAAIGNNTIDINGGLDIRYDSCNIKSSMKNKPLLFLGWKHLY